MSSSSRPPTADRQLSRPIAPPIPVNPADTGTRRAFLHKTSLAKLLLAEAIYLYVRLKNRTSTKALGSITPHERLYREKSNLANVPEWGQRVWVYNVSGAKLDLEDCKLDG